MACSNQQTAVQIRELRSTDWADWQPLWDDYLRFYETVISPEVTTATWARVVSDEQVHGLGAFREHQLAGFALLIVHPATWTLTPTIYLEDLFVANLHRGRGLGRALLNSAIAEAKSRGCSSIYWHTNQNNKPARALYDSYCAADNSVRYRLKFETEMLNTYDPTQDLKGA